ncbi:Immunoglobulin I-set domain protein [Chthoniobacter flavus Ellin428]|uniref:Immunoglobulin I-set domain protein n=1 Tax=Chthoniobacter flavus Ellin428 TaxID=497964 RepID=B4D6D6_9BACT|nr:immunoglobulin domain-containing protein [Chthoniobacter flavus]EDY18045.1 Immunoglobulin I-set domain protein [Chthoniobacter flavus Ellin428]TCO88287.1 immunoglobulin I-set domain protein [Chthoniobacter flavus]
MKTLFRGLAPQRFLLTALWLALALVGFGGQAMAQTGPFNGQVAAGTAGSYDWPFSCVARNPTTDEIYGFWRRDSGSTAVYNLIKWTGSAWTSVGTIPAASVTTNFNATDYVSMAIDSTGAFHVAVSGAIGTGISNERGVWYGTSATGATSSWTFTKVETYTDPNGWKNTYAPQIRVDSQNHPHIAFDFDDVNGSRSYAARYRWFDGTTWQGSGTAGNIYVNAGNANNEVNYVNLALDTNDKPHFVLQSELNGSGLDGSLVYVNRVSGSYSSPIIADQGTTNNARGYVANIIVEPSGKIDIVYGNDDGSLRYATAPSAAGPFTAVQINGNVTGYTDYCSFSRNSSGDLFVVYNNNSSSMAAARLPGGTGSTWTVTNLFTVPGTPAEGGTFYSGILNNAETYVALFDYVAAGAPPRNLWGANGTFGAAASAPSVTSNPTSTTVNAGSTATFTAAASGSPAPTVQWQVSTDGGSTFNNVSGATSTTLSFTTAAGDNGKKYRAVFTNASGSATSTAATLTVNFAPSVTTNPSSTTVNSGATASFTAAASGNPSPTVQWQVSTDGGSSFNNVSGATSTTLSFTTAAGDNGKKYRAVFTNSVGSATSTAATLTVNFAPTVTTNPTATTVNAGATASFSAAASANPAATVQWQVSTDGGSSFNNVSGATSTTLSFTTTGTQNGNQYRAVFTNSGGSATTTAATLTVNIAPTVTTNPTSTTAGVATNATFTAAAVGNPAPTVQWQVSTDGGATFNNVSGATSTTLSFTTTGAQNGNQYRAVFTNAAGSATTTAATLTVTFPDLTVTVAHSPTTFVAGQTFSLTFVVTNSGVAATSGTITLTCPMPSGLTLSSIVSDATVNATSSTVSQVNATRTTPLAPGASTTITANGTVASNAPSSLSVTVTVGGGSETNTTNDTATDTVTVNAAPVVTTNPATQTVTAGNAVTFTVAASGNPTPTVQWQVSTDGGSTFNNVAGATSTNLTFTTAPTDNGNKYRAVFTNVQGTATTTAATLNVQFAPIITTNPNNATITIGSPVTFNAAANANPAATVQWQLSSNGGASFTNIVGATSTTLSFTPTAGDDASQYRAVFTNIIGSTNTTAATLTVNLPPTVTLNPSSSLVNTGSAATFMAGATGRPAPTVQWQVSTNSGASFSDIGGATSTTLSFTVDYSMNTYQYRAVFSNVAGSATTTAATLTVNRPPVATPLTFHRNTGVGLRLTVAQILAGASDPDSGDTVKLISLGTGTHGATRLTTTDGLTGTVTYAPLANDNNNDAFTYTVQDSHGMQATGTVSVIVDTGSTTPTSTMNITSFQYDPYTHAVVFDVNGLPSTTYGVQYSPVVPATTWTSIGTVTTNSTGLGHYTDSAHPGASGYWRVVYPATP